MMKHEFEAIAKIEVTDEMYETIEKMYMATEMSKTEFVKMLNLKAIAAPKKENPIIRVCTTYAPNGNYIGFEAELIGVDIATGKTIVKRLTGDKCDAWAYVDTYEYRCIIKE